MRPDKRSLGAFLKVPFVAAGAWYLCELGSLWVVNGHLRLRPDVLAFGIGTLPNLLATGLVARQFVGWMQQQQVRTVAGLLLILFGLYTLYRGLML